MHVILRALKGMRQSLRGNLRYVSFSRKSSGDFDTVSGVRIAGAGICDVG